MMKTIDDDGLEWLREIRRKMSAKFDRAPRKAATFYQKMQQHYTGRLYHRVPGATLK